LSNSSHQGASVGDAPRNTVQEPDFTSTQATAVVDAPVEVPRPSAASMIVFDQVTKVYEPDVIGLRDVSFHIVKG
jgi:hypothetical protein